MVANQELAAKRTFTTVRTLPAEWSKQEVTALLGDRIETYTVTLFNPNIPCKSMKWLMCASVRRSVGTRPQRHRDARLPSTRQVFYFLV